MSLSKVEERLIKLDEELHSILKIVQEFKKKSLKDVAESTAGAWGYEVDSKDFVEKMRKSKRLSWVR